jgi:hypothetical protein
MTIPRDVEEHRRRPDDVGRPLPVEADERFVDLDPPLRRFEHVSTCSNVTASPARAAGSPIAQADART